MDYVMAIHIKIVMLIHSRLLGILAIDIQHGSLSDLIAGAMI